MINTKKTTISKYAITVILLVVVLSLMIATVYADGGVKIDLLLDTYSAEVGNLPKTVTMTVKVNEPIVPIQLSGETYSSNEDIKITQIIDGDKELCSSAKTGRFAWLGARNEKEVSSFATIVFSIPEDLQAGTYTFGIRYASATDKNGNEILASSEQTVTFTVADASPEVSYKNNFSIFNNYFYNRKSFFGGFLRWF